MIVVATAGDVNLKKPEECTEGEMENTASKTMKQQRYVNKQKET